ncbi:MAG: VanZ family protein [Muribaculaceae bacterium]
MLRRLQQFWPSLLTLAVVLYATWLPADIEPSNLPPIPYLDKLIHAVLLGGLCGAVIFDCKRRDRHLRLSRRTVWRVVAVAAAFAVVDEVVQGLLPIDRPGDYVDLLADWLGIIIARFTAPPAVEKLLHKT